MATLLKRNLKVYFKNISNIFFSLIGVLVIFVLFVLFIGNRITSEVGKYKPEGVSLDGAMAYWMVAGMLASSAITTSLGAYSIMVADKENKLLKDIYVSPVKKSAMVACYMITGMIVSLIIAIITLIFGEIYALAKGGKAVSAIPALKVLGVILLSSFASNALMCFIVSFIKSNSIFTIISIIIGTLIGFLVGAYVNIGVLPSAVQWIIKLFPNAHAAALFRQFLMEDSIKSIRDSYDGNINFSEAIKNINENTAYAADSIKSLQGYLDKLIEYSKTVDIADATRTDFITKLSEYKGQLANPAIYTETFRNEIINYLTEQKAIFTKVEMDVWINSFNIQLGNVYEYNKTQAPIYAHVLVLVFTGVIFYGLSIFSLSRKPKKM
ncbi:ABC transporter permease [Mycoplasma struthionis]|uniref:ABC transporter permease n=1 Tax=Mycoplasma struthionis TaxID=538220 RepID=A0A502M7B3_9MOLU|nr:ABC transporter permease [Mycoplasma struthionis]TPI01544.1 ABC transporter permease [Mycoplasma struthionis]